MASADRSQISSREKPERPRLGSLIGRASAGKLRNVMSRRSKREEKLLKEQDTVGMQRAERKEQEELAGKKKKAEAAMTKAQRMLKLQEKEKEMGAHPPRIARVGKPLIR
jgi:hypothetical protein